MPAICGGRPDTVAPKTTSSRPTKLPARFPTPPGPGCSWSDRARVRAPRADRCGSTPTSRRSSPDSVSLCADASAGASSVGSSTPARARCHTPSESVGPAVRRSTRGSRGTGAPAAAPWRRRRWRTGSAGPDQQRHRPAVEQDVVVGDDQPLLVPAGADQHEPQQRRRRPCRTRGAGRRRGVARSRPRGSSASRPDRSISVHGSSAYPCDHLDRACRRSS